MAIKPSFFSKYRRRYDSAQSDSRIQAGISDRVIKMQEEELNDQYPRMFRSLGDAAEIRLFGPMSEQGPDWIDLFLGYGGTAYINLIRACDEILKNSEIKNIKILANTPGGNTDGLDSATMKLQEVVDSGRNVTVINMGDIASAGVWFTSPAQKIIAGTPTAMIGSIGVVIDTLDYTGYYHEMGIERLTITNTESPNKWPDLSTKEGQKIITKELDALYSVFVSRVTDGRTIGAEGIKKLKGEMIIAAEAVKIGLMDGVEGEAKTSAGLTFDKSAEIQIIKELSMDEDVKSAFSSINNTLSAISGRLDTLESGKSSQAPAADTPAPEKIGLSDEDKKFCSNLITGSKYTKAITEEAVKALSGDVGMTALKAMVAGADTAMELAAVPSNSSETEETPPEGSLPGQGGVKYDGKIDGNEKNAMAAEDERRGFGGDA